MGKIEETIAQITPQSTEWRHRAVERLDRLCMPHWALGRLMDLAVDLVGMTRSMTPTVSRKTVVVMAADHGVAGEGVSKYPQEVTAQMVQSFVQGGAAINALARLAGAEVVVVDMGVCTPLGADIRSEIVSRPMALGTRNMAAEPAMSRDQAIQAVETGIEIAGGLAESDLLAMGEMGIGNTTASAAIVCSLTGATPEAVVGRGTGLDDRQLVEKQRIVRAVLARHAPDRADPLGVLSAVGGFEIGGLVGLILGAAAHRIPVLMDGFITTAAAMIAVSLCPSAAAYLVASHRSVEKGHDIALDWLDKRPLLDLSLRLGEGTGAVTAMALLESAARILTDIATFEEASVSGAAR